MYDVIDSKYTYKGTDILKNKLDIMDEELLKEYQKRIVSFKLSTINFIEIPYGYNEDRLKFIHKYLFDNIYYFAGEYRQENIVKDNFRFAEYEYIETNISNVMKDINIESLKQLSFDEFCKKISYYMTELNVLHPFREGNGRTIREFIRELIYDCGYIIDWSKIDYNEILRASKEAVIEDSYQIEILSKSIIKESV